MTSDRWKQVESLFHQALEKSPDERSAFLDAACAGNLELRAEVQTLLERDDADDLFDGSPPVTPGTRLGQYEILSPLGQGGMGEVWRAKDTTLGREVAIKTLPEVFARDPERLARFEREAKLLASLNHPNIAVIHGLEGGTGGRQFLVLELIEGPTLQERLEAGAVPVDASLDIALQIARALEAAHDKSIIHRDLKPGNIKVADDGLVKVLDFGLAKVVAGPGPDPSLSNSPTMSLEGTARGVLLGTAAYMAPEQARGEPADPRADVWAFGCVLFEMLTGRRAFAGSNVSDVLASILKTEPDWTALPENLHPRIRYLLERCLEKDPRDRCQGISEAGAEIRKSLTDSDHAPEPLASPPRGRRTGLRWVAGLVLLVAAGTVLWSLWSPGITPPDPIRFYHESRSPTFRAPNRDVVAVSRDGRRFAYNTPQGVYLRTLGEPEDRLVIGPEAGPLSSLFFSPDGQWIGAWSSEFELRKFPVDGGSYVRLAETMPVQGATWTDDGIYYAQPQGILRVSAEGGDPEVIIPVREGGLPELFVDPQVLPDGSILCSTLYEGVREIVILRPEVPEERKRLFRGDRAVYVSGGYVILSDPAASPGTLFARAFDPGTHEFGPAEVIEEGVRSGMKTHFAVSENGETLVYIPADSLAGAPPVPTRFA